MNIQLASASLAALTLLSACGGGGGDSTPSADAQGIWSGPASTGYNVDAVVLDNGEVWGIYTSSSSIYGALFGSATVTGQDITIRGTDFNFSTNRSSAGTLTGTVIPKKSINARSSDGTSVALSYNPSYDTPASAAAVAGTWSFTGRSGAFILNPGSVTIDGSGKFTLLQTGCTSTGSIVPRPGGKNIYNFNLSSAGPNCAVGYSSIAGVTYLDSSRVPNRFLTLGLTPSKNDGLIVLGSRS